jgi:general secretion pathway protein E
MELTHILKHRYDVAEEAIAEALHVQSEKGGRLSEILIDRKAVTETQMLEALSMQYELPFWPELPMESVGSDFSKKISIQFLKRHNIVPMAIPSPTGTTATGSGDGDRTPEIVFVIAVNDPSNFNAVDDLANLCRFPTTGWCFQPSRPS